MLNLMVYAELYVRANRPENLEVESEGELYIDDKGPYVLHGEVEKRYQGDKE